MKNFPHVTCDQTNNISIQYTCTMHLAISSMRGDINIHVVLYYLVSFIDEVLLHDEQPHQFDTLEIGTGMKSSNDSSDNEDYTSIIPPLPFSSLSGDQVMVDKQSKTTNTIDKCEVVPVTVSSLSVSSNASSSITTITPSIMATAHETAAAGSGTVSSPLLQSTDEASQLATCTYTKATTSSCSSGFDPIIYDIPSYKRPVITSTVSLPSASLTVPLPSTLSLTASSTHNQPSSSIVPPSIASSHITDPSYSSVGVVISSSDSDDSDDFIDVHVDNKPLDKEDVCPPEIVDQSYANIVLQDAKELLNDSNKHIENVLEGEVMELEKRVAQKEKQSVGVTNVMYKDAQVCTIIMCFILNTKTLNTTF